MLLPSMKSLRDFPIIFHIPFIQENELSYNKVPAKVLPLLLNEYVYNLW